MEQVQEQKPAVEQKQEQPQEQTQENKPSVLERVSQAKNQETKSAEGQGEEQKFNYNDIENIKDPEARKYAEAAYKSFEKGYQKKFQDLATERKAFEEQAKWTPERVQSLLNNQEFVTAAQSVAQSNTNQSGGTMTDEEWSALTEGEKKQISEMQTKVNQILQQNHQMVLNQQHEQNKGKYATYDAKLVDNFRNDLMTGKYQATSEDLWKAIDYENAVNRAYQLGLEDRKSNVAEKMGNTSVDGGVNANAAGDIPQKEEGESNHAYFIRLATWRKEQMQSQQ